MRPEDRRLRALLNAKLEAERFIPKAQAAIDKYRSGDFIHHNKENASAKRASMDLSNALIEVRKSAYD
jgi:hypothetical protein